MNHNHVLALSLVVSVATSPVFAARDHQGEHQHPFKGPNGGIVEHIGPYHGELVVGGSRLVLFLKEENGAKVDPTQFRANVVLVQGTVRRGSFSLNPAEGGRLTGNSSGKRGDKAVVTVVFPDGSSAQGGYSFKTSTK